MMTAVGQKADFCTAPCSRKAVPSIQDPSFRRLLRVPSQGLDSGAKRSGNNEQWELRCGLRSSPKDEAVGRRRGNTHRGNGVDRFAERQTHQSEPSGSERVNTPGPLNSGSPEPLAPKGAASQSYLLPPVGGFLPQQSRCD